MVCFILNEACSEWIFHSPAVCVSLVGFDWGPNPSLIRMNVGWNIHQMLSQKLYPLLSTAHRGAISPPVQTNEAQPGVELRPWVYLLFARIISAALRLCWRVMLCHVGMLDKDGGQQRSIPYISNIRLLYCYCLQVPPQPFNPQRTTSSAGRFPPSVAAAASTNLVRKPTRAFFLFLFFYTTHGSSYMFLPFSLSDTSQEKAAAAHYWVHTISDVIITMIMKWI